MRKHRVAVIDVLGKSPSRALYARAMRANLASIMPQVVAVWCEEAGHEVHLGYYSGYENMVDPLPGDLDLVFIGAFTQSAQLAYALSHYFQARGAVTVLGGPHARAYPGDAQRFFDYVVGFTDRAVVDEVLRDCAPHRPMGAYLSADRQPADLPGVRARWKFIEPILARAPLVKIVPMLGSLGCPYRCSFCVDATVPYQPLDFDGIKDDLRFLLRTFPRPRVGWHDPNFGVRFDEYLDLIEDAVPRDRIDFVAESSLSLLSEPNVLRLKANGFKAILPGIESWFGMGNKSKTGSRVGSAKVSAVSDHVNTIMRHLPYLQANFVLGLDCDEGPEPFELTKEFLDRAPGAFPAYSLLTAFGVSAPLNADYARDGRMLPVPFHMLNNHSAMNVRPLHYDWPEFYDRMIDLCRHSFSKRSILNRLRANRGPVPRLMNVIRAVSSEGWAKTRYFSEFRARLDTDRALRRCLDGETREIPPYFLSQIEHDLGPLWEWLPEGALVPEGMAVVN